MTRDAYCTVNITKTLIRFLLRNMTVSVSQSPDVQFQVHTRQIQSFNSPVFALSDIASQNATQIDPPCESKCHMCCTYVRYKKTEVV